MTLQQDTSASVQPAGLSTGPHEVPDSSEPFYEPLNHAVQKGLYDVVKGFPCPGAPVAETHAPEGVSEQDEDEAVKCRNGLHELDSDWRAANGARCRECYVATQERYNASYKGCTRNYRYDHTAAGIQRKIKYDIEVRGRDEDWIWYGARGDALAEREAYEASGSSLSFVDWLNEVDPLPKLRMPA